MEPLVETLRRLGVLPMIRVDRREDAVPLAKAFLDGGTPVMEVTFRTPCAGRAVAAITGAFPAMTVGAGTILTTEQADEAIAAGAAFIVSPGLNPRVVRHCREKGVPVFPGVMTPSDIEQALACGLRTVKYFPAEAAGGVSMLKALAGPYAGVRFIATGGIGPANLGDYLRLPQVLACGGSFFVPPGALEAGDFEAVASVTRETDALVRAIRGEQAPRAGAEGGGLC